MAAVSDSVARSLRSHGLPGGRVSVVPNGIEIGNSSLVDPTLRREIGPRTGPVVGMVSRLVRGKGAEFLLRAAPKVLTRFPETVFTFVGNGPERGELEELSHELGIQSSVVFVGERSDMTGVYASIDIFILPSLNEGMPMSVLEAMAARKAVIATHVGAIPQLIIHEKTGLLIRPSDSLAIRDAIVRLLENPSLAKALGEASRTWAAEHFSADTMARRYFDIYQQVLSRRALAGYATV